MPVKLTVAAIVLLSALRAAAQSSAEVNAGIQYNFASPGARSMGRAGAFIADASDATAVYTNPAGLVNLPAREVSLELRTSSFTNVYSDRGHAFGPPTLIGNDTIAGVRDGRSTNVISIAPFASLVVPFQRFTIAAYRHELANFEASARTNGVFFDLPISPNLTPGTWSKVGQRDTETQLYRHYPSVSSLDLHITGLGVATGLRVTDRLSIGAGLRRYDASLDSTTMRFEATAFYGDPDYTRLNNVQTQQGHAHTFGANAGFLFDLTGRVSIGGSYRPGFSFPLTVTYTDGAGARPPRTGRFNVPSFYGLGLSVRPTDYWSVAMDVNRINYSVITHGFVLLFTEEPRYFVPNGTEVRLGSEWLFTSDRGGVFQHLRWPLAVEAGAWRDPDHTIRVSDASDSQAILFRRGKDDYHLCAGLGLIFGTRAQVHLAADHSTRQTLVSLTAMARF